MKHKKMMGGGMADRRGRAMTRMGADAAGRAMMMKGGKVKKMRAGGNTSRMNDLEELGRIDARKNPNQNDMAEKRRVVGELKMNKGGGVSMTSMMKDKEGRAMAKNKKKMTKSQMADAVGRAMIGKPVSSPEKRNFDKAMADSKRARTGGSSAPMKAKGKKMMGGGKVKGYKKGGKVSSASKRADGIAQRGHTRGRMV